MATEQPHLSYRKPSRADPIPCWESSIPSSAPALLASSLGPASMPLPGVPEELPLLVVPAVRGREHPTLVHQDTRAVEREAIEEGDLPGLRAARTRGARSLGVPIRVVSGEHRLCGWRKEVEIRAGRAGQGLSLGSQGNELGLGAQPVGWVWRGRDRMYSVCRVQE